MRPTLRLHQHTACVTLFTRENCSLCETAKSVIHNLSNKRNFEFHQVNVMASDQQRWKLLYEFDTPVLHVQTLSHPKSNSPLITEARKLMHRFDEKQVEQLIDEAEGH